MISHKSDKEIVRDIFNDIIQQFDNYTQQAHYGNTQDDCSAILC